MRTLSLIALLLLAAFSPAAPALGDKPRWEYAELTYRTTPGRPAGVDADGNAVPAVPSSIVIRWISGAGEIEAKGWGDLAQKLKVAGFKLEGSAAFQKIQLLNYLGGEGWELMDHGSTTSTPMLGGRGPAERPAGLGSTSPSGTWMMKRRAP